jgi:ADP-heptose:LPS heptosyltransferase
MIRNIIKTIVDHLILLECLFFTRQSKHSKKRVLLFRKDVLGDFVIFLPTLKYYREYYKDYEITLVVSDMCIGYKPLFTFIDDVIEFNQKKFRSSFWYRRSFIKNLAKQGFDIAIYPVYSSEPVGDLIMKATKAPTVLDFKKVIVDEHLNEMDRNMSFVSEVTKKKCEATYPTIDISKLDRKIADNITAQYPLSEGKYIVMVPGSSATYKMWQLEKMAKVADFCSEKGYKVVLLGGPSEKHLGEKIIQASQDKGAIVDLIGKTDLATLSHIVAKAKFYFGNDTGTLHIAAAVNIPAIAVMGGGHFRRFFPYGNLDRNRIIFDEQMKCKNDAWECAKGISGGVPAPCIASITVEQAKNEIEKLLAVLK